MLAPCRLGDDAYLRNPCGWLSLLADCATAHEHWKITKLQWMLYDVPYIVAANEIPDAALVFVNKTLLRAARHLVMEAAGEADALAPLARLDPVKYATLAALAQYVLSSYGKNVSSSTEPCKDINGLGANVPVYGGGFSYAYRLEHVPLNRSRAVKLLVKHVLKHYSPNEIIILASNACPKGAAELSKQGFLYFLREAPTWCAEESKSRAVHVICAAIACVKTGHLGKLVGCVSQSV
eukprot:Skav202908  [mRNA]  locus=scaffold1565:52236:57707:+ [translate_table: standard]